MLVLLQLVSFVCSFLPLVSRFPPLVTPFLSFQFLPSVRYCFPSSQVASCRYVRPFVSPLLKSHSLLLPCFCRLLQSVCYLNSFLATLPFIHYFHPFVSTLSFHSLLPSFLFNSFLSFISSFRSFQLSPFIRYFLPFVSALTSSSFLHSKSFISLRPSFPITSFKNPIRYFFLVVSPLTVRLSLELFRFNSFLSFITSFLSFQLSPFIGCFLPSGSTLTCRSLLLPFVSSRSCRCVLSFVSPLMQTVRIHSLRLPCCVTSCSPFVTWTLSLQLFPLIRYFHPFVSTLLLLSALPSVSTLCLHSLFSNAVG